MESQIIGILIALLLNLIDIISGVIGAVVTKTVASGSLRNGIFKKCGFIFVYLLAFIVDNYGSLIGFNLSVSILPIILLYIAITEITSIIENVSIINPDISKIKLLSIFEITNDEEDE